MKIEAGVDSCAADKVIPVDMFPDIAKKESEASRGGKSHAAANGGEIKNEGEKIIDFVTNEGYKKKAKFPRWRR